MVTQMTPQKIPPYDSLQAILQIIPPNDIPQMIFPDDTSDDTPDAPR
jgi:hypothetical protein